MPCFTASNLGVSIHAPAWGATQCNSAAHTPPLFQFTPPRGGRRKTEYTSSPTRWFQFTPPRGGRPAQCCCTLPGKDVSIHAPAWGATRTGARCASWIIVSIHAPAWGATPLAAPLAPRILMFQFTPPRGGRPPNRYKICWRGCFNSRPRVGGDCPHCENEVLMDWVSIHAPAWGATWPGKESGLTDKGFNSRPRVGGDPGRYPADAEADCFNSRPRVGGDINALLFCSCLS